MWKAVATIIGLSGVGRVVQNTEQANDLAERQLFVSLYGPEAYHARERVRRHDARTGKITFWIAVIVGLIMFARAGHSQPYPYYSQYGYVHPYYGYFTGTASPFTYQQHIQQQHAYYDSVQQRAQAEERERTRRDNAEYSYQYHKAEREHVCNGWNPGGCVDNKPPRMTEDYVQNHLTDLQLQNCYGGASLSCQWLNNRMPH